MAPRPAALRAGTACLVVRNVPVTLTASNEIPRASSMVVDMPGAQQASRVDQQRQLAIRQQRQRPLLSPPHSALRQVEWPSPGHRQQQFRPLPRWQPPHPRQPPPRRRPRRQRAAPLPNQSRPRRLSPGLPLRSVVPSCCSFRPLPSTCAWDVFSHRTSERWGGLPDVITRHLCCRRPGCDCIIEQEARIYAGGIAHNLL